MNPGGQVEISAEYVPGSAVGTDSSNQELLNRVFSFHIQDADNGNTVTKISPDVSEADGSDPITTTNTATLGGGTNEVYFRLNFNDQLANDLADLASTSGALDFGSATQTAVDLLDQVRFGRDA
ncbi:hypothetical protein DM826_01080 [Halonotius aquaticus]|uniref:Uncharacterized protein n=1 Tax=Halonotius aquaticus TaxID=2216978 RepID=A0A3A6QEZ4_9EURY|nr:hypothetical protein DM826_01080 [Halonotius aquaticus]